ncbi:MAG: class I SAM-dependent methyltransferase [Dehalococcoidia bacterium]
MTDRLDRDLLEAKMELFASSISGMMNAAMMHVGRRLGLFDAMRGRGHITARMLADALDLDERFLREWLFQQAAASVIEHRGGDRFELSEEAAVLLGPESGLNIGPSLDHLPALFSLALGSEEAFRTGQGRSFEQSGEGCARLLDAAMGIWNRQSLVADALPLLEGIVKRLRAGGSVADIGCGAGAAAIAVGAAFPKSKVRGYDTSDTALRIAAENLAEAGLPNVTFHNPLRDPLPDEPTFDLVMTIDCLHDMPDPEAVTASVRGAIKPTGVWLIADVEAATPPEANISRAGADMLFALSVSMCLQSGMSEPGGRGLGAVGLPEPAMEQLVRAAGFARFRRLSISHPSNAFYEVRP